MIIKKNALSRWVCVRAPSIAVATSIVLAPALAAACACGCGIFDVGGASGIMPSDDSTSYSVYFRYDYMNQAQNWISGSKGAAAANGDKGINTSFYTSGFQWKVNPNWTLMAELPVYARHLTTTDDGSVQGPPNSVYTGKLTDLGDMQFMADYTGLTPDRSTGLIFGFKLPTGNYTGPNGLLGGSEFDRDSLPGTGSTDVILGAYHIGSFSDASMAGYYVQGRAQMAFLSRDGYRPGNEFDGAAGVDYNLGKVGPFSSISPVVSVLSSYREHDTGPNADYNNSGYFRMLVAPGLQVTFGHFRVYADIEKPIYQHTNAGVSASYAVDGSLQTTEGQLIASTLYKVQINFNF